MPKKKLKKTRTNPPNNPVAEIVPLKSLKPHPKNYRTHPDDQITHLTESLQRFGFYRNVVVSNDGTILAGHGVYNAAQKMGLKEIPVIRMNFSPDDPLAIKLMIGDNEIRHLAEQNDRALSELLKQLKDDVGLMGTGYDEMMLANFLMVTRPESEIKDLNAAAQWVGLPEYDMGGTRYQLVVVFPDAEHREKFVQEIELVIATKGEATWSTRWPFTEREDKASIKFTAEKK